MPFLDDRQVQELLREAGDQRMLHAVGLPGTFPPCCPGAKDYCRSCDEFYWLHLPDCPRYEGDKHGGHRLTIVPFVEER